MFQQHILAGDAEVGRAVLHISRHIGSADNHHAHVSAIGGDDQFARLLGMLGWHNACR